MKKVLICLFSVLFIIFAPITFGGCKSSYEDLKVKIEQLEKSIQNVNLTINYNNNANENDVISLKKGSVIDFSKLNPNVSPSPYLVFDCWCSDSALSQTFDFTASIETDTIIYARWKLNENYMVTQVLSDSMAASGIYAGDYVLLEKVDDRDVLKVDDIILFYLYNPEDGVPTIEDAVENNSLLVLHQIINVTSINNIEYYETHGTSVQSGINQIVSRTLVLGRYIQVIEIDNYIQFIGSY